MLINRGRSEIDELIVRIREVRASVGLRLNPSANLTNGSQSPTHALGTCLGLPYFTNGTRIQKMLRSSSSSRSLTSTVFVSIMENAMIEYNSPR